MRYYSAIFASAILFCAGGVSLFLINPIATNIPDYSISAYSPSGVDLDNNLDPHRGSGR